MSFKKILLALLLGVPAVAHAERLGGLKTSADVALSSKTIANTSTQESKTLNVTSGTIANLNTSTFSAYNVTSTSFTAVSTVTYNNVRLRLSGSSSIEWPDGSVQISSPSSSGSTALFSKSWIANDAYPGVDNSAGDSPSVFGAYGFPLFDLDAGGGEDIRFGTVLKGYASGTLKVDIHYGAAGTGSGTVGWKVKVMCSHQNGTDQFSASYDTENTASTSISGGTTLRVLTQTVTLTNKDSCADGEDISINIKRDSADTFASSAWFLSARLYEQ